MIFLVVALFLFGATVALVLALRAHQKEQGTQALRERVGAQKGRTVVPALDIERDQRMSSVPVLDRLLRSLSIARRIELLLYQAGLQWRVATFLLLVGLGCAAGYLVALTLFHHPLHALVAAAIG